MRRLPFLFFVVYLAFIGGSTYYAQLFPIRVAHHVIITVLLGAWLIHRIRTQAELPQHPLNPLLFAAIVLWIISAFFALDPRISLEATWFSLTHVIMLWGMIALIQRGRGRFLMEVTFLMGALIIIFAGAQFVDWLAQWLPLLHAEMPIPPVLPRLDQPVGVSTWLSGIAAPFTLLLFIWGKSARRQDEKFVLLIMAGLMLIILLLTASRGGYLSLAVGVAIFALMRLWNRQQSNRLLSILSGVGIVGIIVAVVVIMISQSASRASGDRLRFDLWETAFESVASDPITGVGVGMFGRAHRLYRDGAYVDDRLGAAHSLYLNTAAELGIGGLVLLIGLIGVGGYTWRKLWQSAATDKDRFRLEGAAAALIGIGIHSVFDNFTLTSTVLLPLVLIAYTTTTRSLVPTSTSGTSLRRLATIGLAALIGVYGVGLLFSDRAHSEFNRSVIDESPDTAQNAQALDPAMRLYRLQHLYLITLDSRIPITEKIAGYQTALEIEPTWDTGWINLAGLQLQNGDAESALQSLERAAQINNFNSAWFYWARLAEAQNAAPADVIADRYQRSLLTIPVQPDFWLATEARRLAIAQYIERVPIETHYRTAMNLALYEEAAALIPDTPTTASEWWMSGHYALIMNDDAAAALEQFNRGLALCRSCGTLYAWRAQAEAALNGITPSVQRDLRIAELLTTPHDDLRLMQVQLATPEGLRQHQINYVSRSVISQNFEAVLYQGRRANFRTQIGALNPPISDAARAVYSDLAAAYEAEGNLEIARRVYEILLQIAPEDAAAQAELNRLETLP